MTRDFTFQAYEELLTAGLEAGYEHLTVREYLSRDSFPDRFVIHRHDVDRKPENSLQMARIEAEHGVSSTYYFRTIDKTFKPAIFREIDDLGHEIGYHYEDMDRADGDIDDAHRSFEVELERLREHVPIKTVCMHGNPLTAHDNRNLWADDRGFEAYDLLGEAYLSMDFEDVTYFSDTGRTWQDGALKIKDHTMGEGSKQVTAQSTFDLVSILSECDVQRACLLSHPNRWADGPVEYIAESMKDISVNAVKYSINLVR